MVTERLPSEFGKNFLYLKFKTYSYYSKKLPTTVNNFIESFLLKNNFKINLIC
jgi:hypothetical protein